jgi:lipopolysaccharide/colanic/teichoic acid biosynthesis glycosyltransferase
MPNNQLPDYSHLIERLAEPELFSPEDMPTGQPYLHSPSKDLFDVVWTAAVLPFAIGPTAAGAAGVRLIDKEKPLLRQERQGHMMEPYIIKKLTTMPGVTELTHSNGRHYDPRRSKLGRLLSLLRIDEAPQLINVARREMAIIGPRPLIDEVTDNARRLVGPKRADEWLKVRALALPGIFDDFAVMHHGYEIEGDDAQRLSQRIDTESEYILEKASFAEDTRILMDTFSLLGKTVTGRLRMSAKQEQEVY